jgi:uncharacterized protein
MEILWDETKRRSNLRKHGVDFEIAKLVFEDPYHLSEQDRIEQEEFRWRTLGMVEGILLIVGHTYDDRGVIRIMTARRASPKERKQYHET